MAPLCRRALVLMTLAAAAAGAPLLAQKKAELPGGQALPKAVKEALDDRFKRWEVASVDPQAIACRRDGEESPAIVQADFNSDGQQDIALALKVGDEVRLIVIVARMEESTLMDVDSLGRGAAGGYLGIEKRGTKFKASNVGVEDFFPADTLAVYRCGQPKTAYFWAATGFTKVVIP